MLQLPRQLSRRIPAVYYRHSRSGASYSTTRTSPSPPRLPKEEQDIFEDLQRRSTGAFSTPRSAAVGEPASTSATTSTAAISKDGSPQVNVVIEKNNAGDSLHPDMRRGAPPEFEGDVNPKTGEVDGPKNEPLRWGASGDWSYNGRVTDF